MFHPLLSLSSLGALCAFLFIAMGVSSCTHPDNTNVSRCLSAYDSVQNKLVYSYVDQPPTYPEGNWTSVIHTRFVYPVQEELQGLFLIEFVVDIDGTIASAGIIGKDRAVWTPAEEEMIRVIRETSPWNPGRCGDKAVPVRMMFPIHVLLKR